MGEMVHPKQIESELSRLWKTLQRTGKMRACLFNFIIYSKQWQRVEYLDKIARNVIQKFPSRIIFITYDDTCTNPALQTAVSVMTAEENSNDIACDMIEIKACDRNHPRVPFVILPHLLPDLPVYLLHASDPAKESPIDQKLEFFANRMIFDSREATDLPSYARAVLERQARTRADIADLNWARTEGWRQLIASVFKSNTELHRLRSARKITIYFNRKRSKLPDHTHTQAVYLQAWIAAQLGWTLNTVTKGCFSYQLERHFTHIHLIPKKIDSVPSGQVLSLEIQTDSDFCYKMERNYHCPQNVTIEKSSTHFCAIPFHFFFNQDSSRQSLVKEICHRGTSLHYTNTLRTLATIKKGCSFQ